MDRYGIEEAKKAGIPTGGTAAKGWRTENGPDPSLADFGLVEAIKAGYPYRTRQNVIDSDGTVLFGDMHSIGSAETVGYCIRKGKPHIENPTPEGLIAFILKYRVGVLNVAGNRGSKVSETREEAVRACLRYVFTKLRPKVLQY